LTIPENVVKIILTTDEGLCAMAYIFEQSVGKYRYVYEGTSYRDKNGNPRNTRIRIGKVDPITKEHVYTPEYIARMEQTDTPVAVPTTQKRFSIEDIKKSTVKDFGCLYLLRSIAEASGLMGVLQESLDKAWQEVFMLASFLVVTGDPFVYCEDWLNSTESLPVGNMSSQRVSELLKSISVDSRDRFYSAWCNIRSEREYLALDITSSSSYSELIEDVEWGYNRDDENLPQINICMLMGLDSMLPIYQTTYSGSIGDVSTLDTTFHEFDAITGGKPILAVMDKGFFKKSRVTALLDERKDRKFIVPVSFSTSFAKNQVVSERKDIDCVENTIVINGESTRGITKIRSWYGVADVYTHIYYNAKKASASREKIFAKVASLRDEAETDPTKSAQSEEYRKYLNIRKSAKSDSGYTITIRDTVIEDELKHCGWLVLVSNDISCAKEALRIYRAKDVVEKGFMRLKKDLDLGRLRVHSNESAKNKIFVGFIALIILSKLHIVMANAGLYKKMTMQQLIRTLSKLRIHTIAGERITMPITKSQKDIFDAFGVTHPA